MEGKPLIYEYLKAARSQVATIKAETVPAADSQLAADIKLRFAELSHDLNCIETEVYKLSVVVPGRLDDNDDNDHIIDEGSDHPPG
jgi:hypothetical protein